MNLIPVNCKQLILEDAKKGILRNHSLEEIAIHHGISKRTLKKWLMSLGEEHQELRQLWIDNMLAEAKEETENVVSNFPITRTNSK
jgi:transposase-like protein